MSVLFIEYINTCTLISITITLLFYNIQQEDTMITYTLHIDTLKLQVVFINSFEQREVMNKVTKALTTTFPFLTIIYGKSKKGVLTHCAYTAGTKILELTSGAYKDIYKRTLYYINVEVAGLKQYNNFDKIKSDCLKRVIAYFNTNEINFVYNGIDIAVDIQCLYAFIYAFCNKKAAGVKYYTVFEYQPYPTSHYIEKYNRTHNRVMKRSYVYDKSIKENNLIYPLTRFELKLQSSFFNRYPYQSGMLQNELDRYHILYFHTLEEKNAALSLYAQHEDSIRRRDLHKLGLDKYRLLPDTSHLESELVELYNLYEHDLDLPIEEVDNGFDWLFD